MREANPELVDALVAALPFRGGTVLVVTPPGGSSGVAEGVTGAADPGSPAYGVSPAITPAGGSTS